MIKRLNATSIRHCEKWCESLLTVYSVGAVLKKNERRSNLPSLINRQEPFLICDYNTSSLRIQCREIASWMLQRRTCLISSTRFAETRNDENDEGGCFNG